MLNGKKYGTYKMDVQISRSIYSQVQKENNILWVEKGYTTDNKRFM